jgi:hypothetical protein
MKSQRWVLMLFALWIPLAGCRTSNESRLIGKWSTSKGVLEWPGEMLLDLKADKTFSVVTKTSATAPQSVQESHNAAYIGKWSLTKEGRLLFEFGGLQEGKAETYSWLVGKQSGTPWLDLYPPGGPGDSSLRTLSRESFVISTGRYTRVN